MTTESLHNTFNIGTELNLSQKAFEEFCAKEFYEDARTQLTQDDYRYYAEEIAEFRKVWQASEARIRAMLESEEVVEVVAKAVFQDDGYFWPHLDEEKRNVWRNKAKAALKAIVEGIK